MHKTWLTSCVTQHVGDAKRALSFVCGKAARQGIPTSCALVVEYSTRSACHAFLHVMQVRQQGRASLQAALHERALGRFVFVRPWLDRPWNTEAESKEREIVSMTWEETVSMTWEETVSMTREETVSMTWEETVSMTREKRTTQAVKNTPHFKWNCVHDTRKKNYAGSEEHSPL